jgi:hypothetical protein
MPVRQPPSTTRRTNRVCRRRKGVEFAVLPIEMPSCALLTTDAAGRVISIVCDGLQIQWRDIDTVLRGINQYNEDCRAREGEQ